MGPAVIHGGLRGGKSGGRMLDWGLTAAGGSEVFQVVTTKLDFFPRKADEHNTNIRREPTAGTSRSIRVRERRIPRDIADRGYTNQKRRYTSSRTEQSRKSSRSQKHIIQTPLFPYKSSFRIPSPLPTSTHPHSCRTIRQPQPHHNPKPRVRHGCIRMMTARLPLVADIQHF